jgi:hypothetical protein
MVFSGTLTGSILSSELGIPCRIIGFKRTNKDVGNITVNLAIRTSEGDVTVAPYNLVLAQGDSYSSDDVIILPRGYMIFITTSGPLDYFFSIE